MIKKKNKPKSCPKTKVIYILPSQTPSKIRSSSSFLSGMLTVGCEVTQHGGQGAHSWGQLLSPAF